ncbi:hypothetical protein GJ672_05920 [Spiribacter sp. 2438]|uniref:DUF6279 family lipoprotein n=1 Tax=Spiribacter sp. 2438 TaxID=2666185 RepID=UPI0012B064A2|nr:DUF6279 family lipoprotein [Spiribacter sp. 2438]QGM21844.1 hypothetical protein GJ672_05920 [Spiribacter sp. 2438]
MHRLLTVFIIAVMVSACSRVELAYENADWLAAWRIGSYLELDRDQRGRLREGLTAYQAFHRENRLPAVNAQLQAWDSLLQTSNLTPAAVEQRFAEAEATLRTTVDDLIPLAAELLRDLDDSQISALGDAMAEGRDAYVERALEDQDTRAVERARDWVDDLNTHQEQILATCVSDLPTVTEAWSTWRQGIEEELIGLLRRSAPQAEVEAFLRDWWLEDETRPPVLQAYRQTARATWEACTYTLLVSLTDGQREEARQRLARYRNGLDASAAVAQKD